MRNSRITISKTSGNLGLAQVVEAKGYAKRITIDDMIVKTKSTGDYIDDFVVVFNKLRKYNMKLNPKKCGFGVTAGKFSGFMLTQQGI